MKKLLKSYKVEIKPTTKQIQKIEQSIGVCRWLYNEYGLMSIFWTQKVKLFYAALLANNSH